MCIIVLLINIGIKRVMGRPEKKQKSFSIISMSMKNIPGERWYEYGSKGGDSCS